MDPLVRVLGLRKEFPLSGRGWRRRGQARLRAVDGVDLDIRQGEILGLVGESGSGKTTLGQLLVALQAPSEGQILFRGEDVRELLVRDQRGFRRKVQIIFQDPYESLNPRRTVLQAVAEPLQIHGIGSSTEERRAVVCETLRSVEISSPEALLGQYPHELSGGLRQRVAIARAMILRPEFVVADEPVSMLDVSIRAGVLSLMLKFKRYAGVTFLFITHDLAVARYVSDRIAVIYLGKIGEIGEAADVTGNPLHPYTRALLAAVPAVGARGRRPRIALREAEWQEAGPPSGCRFHPRCPLAEEVCQRVEPPLLQIGGRLLACHVVARELAASGAAPALPGQASERPQ